MKRVFFLIAIILSIVPTTAAHGEVTSISGTCLLEDGGVNGHAGTIVTLLYSEAPSLGPWAIILCLFILSLVFSRYKSPTRVGKMIIFVITLLLCTVLVKANWLKFTNTMGEFDFSGHFDEGFYTLELDHDGYVSRSVEFEIPYGYTGDDFVLSEIVLMKNIIPDSRRIEWDPGIPGTFVYNDPLANVADFGAVGDGTTDNYTAIQNAINSLSETGGIVFVPGGDYLIGDELKISASIVLRGAGPENTRLFFDLPANISSGRRHCINISDSFSNPWGDFSNGQEVLSGFTKGSKLLTLMNASMLQVGDFIEIYQDNNHSLMYTSPPWANGQSWWQGWAEYAVGQIAIISSIDGNTIKLNDPLHHNYPDTIEDNGTIRKVYVKKREMVEYAGVEDLYLKRVNQPVSEMSIGHSINIFYGAYCHIKRVESAYTFEAHFEFNGCYKSEILQSYAHDTRDYHGLTGMLPGHSYGAELFRSTSCLIVDNVFTKHSGSIIVHVGSSGNVIAYNYDGDYNYPYGGICLHGHYDNYNLVESNVTQGIGIGEWWGPDGPGNTMLRNKLTYYGITVRDHSDRQNIVGNILATDPYAPYEIDIHDILTCQHIPSCDVHETLSHGNALSSGQQWDPGLGLRIVPESYYLSEKPAFFGTKEWPALNPENPTVGSIPAEDRYNAGHPLVFDD